uniref:AA_permease_C domain-containing protein n=1 Tax=Angiostrongylus cantonensis TaxID=6313 RepID=A0A0K0DCC4_ANGCA
MSAVDIKNVLFRKKTFTGGSMLETPLRRCLGVIDVTFLAVGQMIGAGIYVLAGPIVHSQTGPSIIISFICAGFAALMSAFSYAEFGARYPRAGSAYTYTYVGTGELWAFVIGWTVTLEYMIGNAAVARSWSAYFDTLVNGAISNFTLETIGSLSSGKGFFGRYPDVMSFLLICAVAIVVSLGSKSSASVNNAFVVFNIAVIGFITIYGLTYANFSLWMGTDANGKSRFFPFGFGGTMSGAATCFFAFIGFEILATAGEEAKNPKRTIPIATFVCLSLVTFLYIMMCSALTLMIPYEQVSSDAAFSAAFELKGASIAKYIITIGALAGMLNNLVSGAFALPRCVYAMAEDGLIFSCFARINKFSQVPLIAIVVFTILNAVVALVFDLTALVEFLSIGTLLAYSMVSACVLILRHQAAPIDENPERLDNGGRLKAWVPFRNFWESLPQGRTICIAVVTLVLGYFWLAFTVRLGMSSAVAYYVSCLLTVAAFLFICGHEQNSLELSFRVPLVPLIPCLGLLINVFMMSYLDYLTWIRFLVWMSIATIIKCLAIYLLYGIRHSKEGKKMSTVYESTLTSIDNGAKM